jgi:ankyrin repeat protein
MKMCFFLNWVSRSQIFSLSTLLLITLAWSIPGFCGEIHDAAKTGDLVRVKALLKDNPELVSSRDGPDDTPLHVAAQQGHKDVAELLLAKKAEVNARDKHGDTPLHVASASKLCGKGCS